MITVWLEAPYCVFIEGAAAHENVCLSESLFNTISRQAKHFELIDTKSISNSVFVWVFCNLGIRTFVLSYDFGV